VDITEIKAGDRVHLRAVPEEGFKEEDAFVIDVDTDTGILLCTDVIDGETFFEVDINQVDHIVK